LTLIKPADVLVEASVVAGSLTGSRAPKSMFVVVVAAQPAITEALTVRSVEVVAAKAEPVIATIATAAAIAENFFM